MTCIAYKDGVLAADKQSTDSGMARTVTKISRLKNGRLVGAAGNSSMCRLLIEWLESGAVVDKFPDGKHECQLLVVNLDGSLHFYDEGPVPIPIEDEYTAIGHGRDYAIGAMACGASSVKAVDVACKYDSYCGNGVDVLRLMVDAS